jgi:ABC-type glutathione transport system ATPase component
MSGQTPLLEVRHLRVEFPTRRGTLVALDDVSFTISAGEVLGVVGESGAGKSMTGAAIIGLLEPPGRIAAGEIRLDGKRIDNLRYEDMRRIRGKDIGAIFQDPLTTLNPLYTVGRQLAETMTTHLPITPAEARKRAMIGFSGRPCRSSQPHTDAIEEMQAGMSTDHLRNRRGSKPEKSPCRQSGNRFHHHPASPDRAA